MTLKAIFRSIINEDRHSTVLSEQYLVELVDFSVLCPYLGGTTGIRVIENTDVDANGAVPLHSWTYNFASSFDVTPKDGAPKYKEALRSLNKNAIALFDASKPGKLYESLKEYFTLQDAPFQVEGVEYPLRTHGEVRAFRQMLARKFGTAIQSDIEGVLAKILVENERDNLFKFPLEDRSQPPQAKVTKGRTYPNWALFG